MNMSFECYTIPVPQVCDGRHLARMDLTQCYNFKLALGRLLVLFVWISGPGTELESSATIYVYYRA